MSDKDKDKDKFNPDWWKILKAKPIDTGSLFQSLPVFKWIPMKDLTPKVHKEPPLFEFKGNLDPKLQAQIEEKTKKVLEAIEKQMLKDFGQTMTTSPPAMVMKGEMWNSYTQGVGNSTTLPKSEWRTIDDGIAEDLQDIANDLYHCGDQIKLISEAELSLGRLAIGFDRLRPTIKFRAIMENWSRNKIIQEVYYAPATC